MINLTIEISEESYKVFEGLAENGETVEEMVEQYLTEISEMSDEEYTKIANAIKLVESN